MIGCVTIVIIVFMICITEIILDHMKNCDKRDIGWYADPEYEKRISKLEKIIKEEEENK